MKKVTLFFILTLHLSLFTFLLSAQPCLPDGITFTTQEQIDNFQTNYPDCTDIDGDVYIDGDNIFNVDGLSMITSIGGNLGIGMYGGGANGVHNLNSLEGFGNMNTIGGNFDLYASDNLVNFSGLDNLVSIGGYLRIEYGHGLTSLAGLESLLSIVGNIEIMNNDALVSLTGIENLEAESIDELIICNNTSLSSCNVQSICNYLASPNGTVFIYNNASGCNNPPDIANACGFTLPCLPFGNYLFQSQSEIDNFKTDYPNCTELNGGVNISGNDIINLNGLDSVFSIEGTISISSNSVLTNLSGLSSLTFVGENIIIAGNPGLTSLIGLESLDSIGNGLHIGLEFMGGNPSLASLSGLDNLTKIGGNLSIVGNPGLTNLTGSNNLTSIEGSLEIGTFYMPVFNSSLINLEGLNNVNYIGGGINICNNSSLTNLMGLEGLTSLSGGLSIWLSASLQNLKGLDNVTIVEGSLGVTGGSSFTSLSGLENLDTVVGSLYFFGEALSSISSLENLTSVGGLSIGGSLLNSLTGLENLSSVNGEIKIFENSIMTSLSGFDYIDASSISDLIITNNNSLSTCHVQSICDYLAAPNGSIDIEDNGPGCNSVEEVQYICDSIYTSTSELSKKVSFNITPNPLESTTLIQYTLPQKTPVTIRILELNGREITTLVDEVQQHGEQSVVFNTVSLPAGIYFCVLKTAQSTITKKIIKLN